MTTNSNNENGAKHPVLPDLELLTPKEAARFLKLSESFLAKARMRGDGPRYRKLSRSVRYTKSDLLLWLKACAKTSTAEGSAEQTESQAAIGMKRKGDPSLYTSDKPC